MVDPRILGLDWAGATEVFMRPRSLGRDTRAALYERTRTPESQRRGRPWFRPPRVGL